MSIDWSAIISNITWQSVTNSLINLGITGVLFWGALKLVAIKIIEFKVNQKMQVHKEKLDEQLEAYKSELQHDIKAHEQKLQVMTEEVKFDFARRQQDFGLYNTKRHETYIKLHCVILEAQSRVFNLRGTKKLIDYSKFTLKEIQEWLDEGNFMEINKKYVLNIWETDKNEAVRQVKELLKVSEEHKADIAIREANNTFVNNQLYISDNIVKLVSECVKNLRSLHIEYMEEYIECRDRAKEEELCDVIMQLINQIIPQMKSEMKKGYYSDD